MPAAPTLVLLYRSRPCCRIHVARAVEPPADGEPGQLPTLLCGAPITTAGSTFDGCLCAVTCDGCRDVIKNSVMPF